MFSSDETIVKQCNQKRNISTMKMVSAVSENVASDNYLYQGTSAYSPDPVHFENKAPEVSTQNGNYKPKQRCCVSVFLKLKLEIVSFLFTLFYISTKISSSSMILDKVCLTHLKYPNEICNNLENYTEIKLSIVKLSTNYQLGHTLIQTAPAALLSCFVGPWSDRYGRKLVVTIAIIGMVLDNLGSAVCAYYLDSRVEYYYIPALFTGASGGVVTLLSSAYSYASDTTPFGSRTMKYALIEMATGVGSPIGAAAGGWIYNFFGYAPVFITSLSGMCACLLWVTFLMPETRGLDNKDSWKVKLNNFFSCTTFKENFIATAKQRPNKGRTQILLLIASMCFIAIATNSTGDISYLYVHHQFNWGNTEYSTITAIYSVCAIILLIMVVPLFKRYRVGDPLLGFIGTTSAILRLIGVGVAWKPTVYHIANLLGLLSSCAPLAARSRISKVVSNDDLGKVFSFVATAEALLPVLTTVLIAQMFNAFLSIYPGVPFITLALLLIPPFSVFAWTTRLPVLNYEDIHHETNQQEQHVNIET